MPSPLNGRRADHRPATFVLDVAEASAWLSAEYLVVAVHYPIIPRSMRAHHATARKGKAATGRASSSRHEDPAALLTVSDLTGCGPMKAIHLGRREREVAPLARTSDETCHAHPTEAAT